MTRLNPGFQETANSIALASDSGFVISRYTYHPALNFSTNFLVKLDKNGVYQWSLANPGTENYEGWAAVCLPDGSITTTWALVEPVTSNVLMALAKITPIQSNCCYLFIGCFVGQWWNLRLWRNGNHGKFVLSERLPEMLPRALRWTLV